MDPVGMGRLIVIAGLLLLVVGGLLMAAGKMPMLGRFPFSLVFQREGFTLVVPIAAMIVISVVLTVALNLLGRFLR